jgi:uncharacterized protein
MAAPGRFGLLALALLLCLPAHAQDAARCLVEAARKQIGVTLHYDGDYVRIPYPNGDIPVERGVCTDVVVRAYRSFGIDLQKLVHEDMSRSWERYPKFWGLTQPDSNIDHRRVPNLATFFGRRGNRLPIEGTSNYLPGDIVTWRLGRAVPHIGFVSDRRTADGTPLIIHNIGFGAVEEDALYYAEITGHYRYLPPALAQRCGESTQ